MKKNNITNKLESLAVSLEGINDLEKIKGGKKKKKRKRKKKNLAKGHRPPVANSEVYYII